MPRPQGITSFFNGVFFTDFSFKNIPRTLSHFEGSKTEMQKLKMTEKVKESRNEPVFPRNKHTLKDMGFIAIGFPNLLPFPSPLLLQCAGESQCIFHPKSIDHTERLTLLIVIQQAG